MAEQARLAPGGLFKKEISVAGCCFRILVDGDDDRLNVLVASAFSRGHATNFLQILEEGRRFVCSSSNHLTDELFHLQRPQPLGLHWLRRPHRSSH
jgi:hypothetical protein